MVKEEKLQQVENLKNVFDTYSTIGIVDMHKMPTKQLQEIKKAIRGKGEIIVTKKSILLHALKKVEKKNIQELEKNIPTQPSLIVSNISPFKFYLTVSRMKSPTYAKEGDVAEDEIVVFAGPTGLMPGPVISEFGKLGIPAGVEEGKVAIKKDKTVAKKGSVISKDLASILRKLKIQPAKVGIRIVVIYENGILYAEDVLNLAGDAYIEKLKLAHQEAMNLSVSISYPTKENIKILLAKAYQNARAVQSKIGGGN